MKIQQTPPLKAVTRRRRTRTDRRVGPLPQKLTVQIQKAGRKVTAIQKNPAARLQDLKATGITAAGNSTAGTAGRIVPAIRGTRITAARTKAETRIMGA